MTAPDYREQADEMLNEPCFGGEGHATEPGEWGRTFFKKDCRACLASWASRIAEERDALLREALSKNGPRAHTLDCDESAPCWLCRARRLLGEGREP